MTSTRQQSKIRDRAPASRLGAIELLRWAWTQLTSMRTALILLFALAVVAIPGSLVPQRPTTPIAVNDFIRANPTLGPIYDRLGLFSVYNSVWFSAVYLLLFLSLIGCIIPRTTTFVRGLRAQPPRTPRHLSRLPSYRSRPIENLDAGSPTDLLDTAESMLRRSRYRVVRDEGSVRAERGYLREAGNLVFHVSLILLLIGVAAGGLFGYRGSSLVIVGQSFTNNRSQYDDFTAGGSFEERMLRPFTIKVNEFNAQFETGTVQTGAARVFEAMVEVSEPGRPARTERLEVNSPLNVAGSSVHLIRHGYAPVVTVLDGNGDTAFSGPVPFLPQDGNFSSAGSIKAPDARPSRLAFQGFFLPTAVVDEQGPRSVFPDAFDPALFLNAWTGPPREETGEPENVYTLNTRGLTQIRDKTGEPVRLQLRPGQSITLPDGQGTITMNGWARWIGLQVSQTPALPLTLLAVGLAITGLSLSLFVRPRRIWVRTRRIGDDAHLLEIGGLDRAGARTGLDSAVADLAATLGPADGPNGSDSDPQPDHTPEGT